jgi:hypothetical protein
MMLSFIIASATTATTIPHRRRPAAISAYEMPGYDARISATYVISYIAFYQ